MPRTEAGQRAHTRASNRASYALRQRHADEWRALYDGFRAQADEEAAEHDGLTFRPGPRPDGLQQPVVEVEEVCDACETFHVDGHTCTHDRPPGGSDPLRQSRLQAVRCLHCGRDGRWARERCVARAHQYVNGERLNTTPNDSHRTREGHGA